MSLPLQLPLVINSSPPSSSWQHFRVWSWPSHNDGYKGRTPYPKTRHMDGNGMEWRALARVARLTVPARDRVPATMSRCSGRRPGEPRDASPVMCHVRSCHTQGLDLPAGYTGPVGPAACITHGVQDEQVTEHETASGSWVAAYCRLLQLHSCRPCARGGVRLRVLTHLQVLTIDTVARAFQSRGLDGMCFYHLLQWKS